MTEKTASEKVDEEKIVIDVDEPESTVEDLPSRPSWGRPYQPRLSPERRRWPT